MKKIHIPRTINWNYEWGSPEYKRTSQTFLGIKIRDIPPKKKRNYDSRNNLEKFGFIVEEDIDPRFYLCVLPDGWTVKNDEYWTYYFDSTGQEKFVQFDKYTAYDDQHFVDFYE